MNVDAFLVVLVLFAVSASSNALRVRSNFHIDYSTLSNKVVVDQSGHGNFTSVQNAIDWVPHMNNQWTRIQVRAGIYNEQVTVQRDKQFIYLEGEGQEKTVIQASLHGSVASTSTFSALADNFVASHITFKNTYNIMLSHNGNGPVAQAPALYVTADKATFYDCGIISLQDSLADMLGRHHFNKCYIEGAVDFIWGHGQSIYTDCEIYYRSRGPKTIGYITAQGRVSNEDAGGFVFINGRVDGEGTVYLGRAWRPYSRVIFYKTYLGANVAPLGWSAWHGSGHEDQLTYVEDSCYGPGSDTSKRVSWMKKLYQNELSQFVDARQFIDTDGWMETQPPVPS